MDAAAHRLAAMREGLAAIKALPFVLEDPPNHAVIDNIGDSTVDLRFFGWLDQRHTGFGKGRSLAIDAAKRALEGAGFELPEPIYRVRMDAGTAPHAERETADEPEVRRTHRAPPKLSASIDNDDAAPDFAIERLVSEERGELDQVDLPDGTKPTE